MAIWGGLKNSWSSSLLEHSAVHLKERCYTSSRISLCLFGPPYCWEQNFPIYILTHYHQTSTSTTSLMLFFQGHWWPGGNWQIQRKLYQFGYVPTTGDKNMWPKVFFPVLLHNILVSCQWYFLPHWHMKAVSHDRIQWTKSSTEGKSFFLVSLSLIKQDKGGSSSTRSFWQEWSHVHPWSNLWWRGMKSSLGLEILMLEP